MTANGTVRRLTARQRRRLGALALACAAAFFAAAALAEGRMLFEAEMWVQRHVQAERTPRLETPMRSASFLGSGGVLVLVTAVACAALWRSQRRLAMAVAATAVTGYLAA